jgi:hypothetical protein
MIRIMIAHRGLVVRDARTALSHHEGLGPHPEERAVARVSKDEATDLRMTY